MILLNDFISHLHDWIGALAISCFGAYFIYCSYKSSKKYTKVSDKLLKERSIFGYMAATSFFFSIGDFIFNYSQNTLDLLKIPMGILNLGTAYYLYWLSRFALKKHTWDNKYFSDLPLKRDLQIGGILISLYFLLKGLIAFNLNVFAMIDWILYGQT